MTATKRVRARSARGMVMATRVVGDKECDGEAGQGNGNGKEEGDGDQQQHHGQWLWQRG